jgi:hypothetical protein
LERKTLELFSAGFISTSPPAATSAGPQALSLDKSWALVSFWASMSLFLERGG